MLPDPVLDAADQEPSPGTWMSHDDAETSVMMQVDGIGAFVRALLSVRLTDGHELTFGLWLGVSPEDLQRAHRDWWEPSYSSLVLDGLIANDVQPWGLLGKPARAVVRDPNETPYLDSSDDHLVQHVLSDEWDHDYVLDALPEHVRPAP